MALLDRLKTRIEAADATDALLEDIIQSATAVYIGLRYPYGGYPVGENGMPTLDFIAQDWVLRAAIEMFSRLDAEGQTSHSESGVTSRSYENGTLSATLKAEIVPLCGIVGG